MSALTDADQDAVLRDAPYVLLKRGLYWRPEAQGYTGVLAEAGRYTEAQVKPYRDEPRLGTTVLLAREAGEFSPACWEETKIATLRARATAAEAERDEALREHTDMMWQRRRADERAEATEAERDKLTADLRAAVIQIGEHARARGEAEEKQRQDRAWYEMTVSVVEEQREGYRARMKAAEKSYAACIADMERGGTCKRVYSDAALGVELEAAEARATTAEDKLRDREAKIGRLREALKDLLSGIKIDTAVSDEDWPV